MNPKTGREITRLRCKIHDQEVELAELRAIKAGLDLMESDECLGCGLISDDFGNWAVSGSGFQNITDPEGNLPTQDKPVDIQSTFFVDADEWKASIAEALDAFVEMQSEDDESDPPESPVRGEGENTDG